MRSFFPLVALPVIQDKMEQPPNLAGPAALFYQNLNSSTMNSIPKQGAQSTSCIVHPQGNFFVMIRDDYMRVCEFLNQGTGKRVAVMDAAGKPESFQTDGEVTIDVLRCAAALLNYFERWTNTKLLVADQAQYTGEEADLWVWGMSASKLESELLGIFPAKNITKACDWLVEKTLLDKRLNPKNKIDKASQYLFNIPLAQHLINGLYSENAETLDFSHLPLRENGRSLEGEWICPQGKTYQSQFLDSYSFNQSNNQSVNQALKAETFSAARENKSDVLDDLDQLHHGSGNSSSVAQQTDRSHSPQSQSNQTDRSHSSGVGESEKKNTVSPRNSLKKEKSVGFKQDEWGIVQLPRAPKYRLASLLATRTMQFLIARDYIECEFAIDRDGDVWILDPKDGDWATEQEVFAGYKDEDGEKVQPTLPLKKLISLVNGLSDEYGPLNIEWYNSTIKQWFMFWKSECERLGDEMVSVVQRKSIGVWMQKALDLEFYEYEEVA